MWQLPKNNIHWSTQLQFKSKIKISWCLSGLTRFIAVSHYAAGSREPLQRTQNNLENESLKQFIIRRWVGVCRAPTRSYFIWCIGDIFAEAIKPLAHKPVIKTDLG